MGNWYLKFTPNVPLIAPIDQTESKTDIKNCDEICFILMIDKISAINRTKSNGRSSAANWATSIKPILTKLYPSWNPFSIPEDSTFAGRTAFEGINKYVGKNAIIETRKMVAARFRRLFKK